MKILKKKNKKLYKKAEEIDEVTKEDKDMAAKMFTSMKENGGVGLSSIQVGYNRNLIVVSHADTNLIMYNPKVIKASKDTSVSLEGCLSFPGQQYYVRRPNTVLVEWKSGKNDRKIKYFSGVVGRIIQHEIDHNNGITMEMKNDEQFGHLKEAKNAIDKAEKKQSTSNKKRKPGRPKKVKKEND